MATHCGRRVAMRCASISPARRRVAGLAVGVELGHVYDHGGVAVAQQAQSVGWIGEMVFLP
ncbi:MAG: hypothetical protein ABSA02_16500 [Trebonia sp.]|jgi:hypothetical protein